MAESVQDVMASYTREGNLTLGVIMSLLASLPLTLALSPQRKTGEGPQAYPSQPI
jgi:hypothetical protein